MYNNLHAEMARKGITRIKLSEITGIPYTTLGEKLSIADRIGLEDAKKIRNLCFPDMSLDYLFERNS